MCKDKRYFNKTINRLYVFDNKCINLKLIDLSKAEEVSEIAGLPNMMCGNRLVIIVIGLRVVQFTDEFREQ